MGQATGIGSRLYAFVVPTNGGIGLGLSPYEGEVGVIHHVRPGGNGERAMLDAEGGPPIGIMLEDTILGYRYLEEHEA